MGRKPGEKSEKLNIIFNLDRYGIVQCMRGRGMGGAGGRSTYWGVWDFYVILGSLKWEEGRRREGVLMKSAHHTYLLPWQSRKAGLLML